MTNPIKKCVYVQLHKHPIRFFFETAGKKKMLGKKKCRTEVSPSAEGYQGSSGKEDETLAPAVFSLVKTTDGYRIASLCVGQIPDHAGGNVWAASAEDFAPAAGENTASFVFMAFFALSFCSAVITVQMKKRKKTV